VRDKRAPEQNPVPSSFAATNGNHKRPGILDKERFIRETPYGARVAETVDPDAEARTFDPAL
jgi:hypothetical protein